MIAKEIIYIFAKQYIHLKSMQLITFYLPQANTVPVSAIYTVPSSEHRTSLMKILPSGKFIFVGTFLTKKIKTNQIFAISKALLISNPENQTHYSRKHLSYKCSSSP